MVGLRNIGKIRSPENMKSTKDTPPDPSSDDLDLWLRKAEMYKELLAFWNSIYKS